MTLFLESKQKLNLYLELVLHLNVSEASEFMDFNFNNLQLPPWIYHVSVT